MDTESQDELDHAYRLFYEDLHGCGCGDPEKLLTVVFRLLLCTPRPGGLDAFNANRYDWVAGEFSRDGVVQLLLVTLSAAGLMEHGGTLRGSWLTAKGTYFRTVLGKLDWSEIDAVGEAPHAGAPCTPACWGLSPAQLQRSPGPIKPNTGYVYEERAGALSVDAVEKALRDMFSDTGIQPGVELPYPMPENRLPKLEVPDFVPPELLAPSDRAPEDRLPRTGRNPYIGCQQVHGTWIHGRPHDCPRTARGY